MPPFLSVGKIPSPPVNVSPTEKRSVLWTNINMPVPTKYCVPHTIDDVAMPLSSKSGVLSPKTLYVPGGSGCMDTVPDEMHSQVCAGQLDMRSNVLHNAGMKWMSTTILLQLHDVFAQIIPPSQKLFMRGRHMLDHVIGARMEYISQPELMMVAVDFQKAYNLISFDLLTVALEYIGLPASYVSVLVSVMSGPIMFCVGGGFEPNVEFRPPSDISQGDRLSPLLFNVVTIFLIYDFQRIKCDSCIRFYADDILISVPGCGSVEVEDLRALLYVLNIFGYFSGHRVNYAKTFVVVKCLAPRQNPGDVAGIIVKPSLRYLGVLPGNVSDHQAYKPAVPKPMARAKTLATLPLGMEEKARLLASRVAPVVYLTARAYEPSSKALAQLNLVQRVALNLNSWHLTMGILSMPKREVGLVHASLSLYAPWVHSHSFVTLVCRPQASPESQVGSSRGWARRVKLVPEETTLLYVQLAPVTIKRPSFLQGSLRAYSQVRKGGGASPPPHQLYPTWRYGTRCYSVGRQDLRMCVRGW